MPKYSEKSKAILGNAHPDLKVLFNEVIKHFDCSILESYRSIERQQMVFRKGHSKLDGINKKSKHNYLPSLAVDVVPYPVDWKNHKRMYFFGGYVLGMAKKLLEEGKISNRIRWGGDWDGDTHIKDQTFIDLPHFEIKK